ncbi:MAG: glycosyltransferase [Ruminococcaceae bacterium]|nr:glycosyltransferase [Oscillospiraceae bacterium]
MEKYSVLMSVYHKEKVEYFKESVDSMLNQTAFPDEIVIVEDGPLTEDLYSAIDTYLNKYPDVFTIVKLEKNKGLGAALNEGLKKCRNELVARMDTDDISLPERCEKQLLKFESSSKIDIVGTQVSEFIDSLDNIVSSRIVPTTHEKIVKFARRRSPFNHPTVMYKKSKVLELGGYKEFGRQEDLELFINMVNTNSYSANLDESLLYYRTNADNFKRRTTWVNCSEYIKVMYEFYKKKYIRFIDLMYVVIGECVMFVFPQSLANMLSNKFLRK